jgi:hypothetical protein
MTGSSADDLNWLAVFHGRLIDNPGDTRQMRARRLLWGK